MLSKRKAIIWNYESESQTGKRLKEDCYEAIENELDSLDSSPSALVRYEDENSLLDKVRKCRFVVDPLYNDKNLLNREVTYNLVSAVIHASP